MLKVPGSIPGRAGGRLLPGTLESQCQLEEMGNEHGLRGASPRKVPKGQSVVGLSSTVACGESARRSRALVMFHVPEESVN